MKIKSAAYGSIAIINHGNGTGHVGFVAGKNENGSIVLLGGNQNNSVRYSAFPANSISNYVYPAGLTPSYILPILKIGKNGGIDSTD